MDRTRPWVVHKFGGTSLADVERFARAGRLVAESGGRGDRRCVVVSAMGGVTDALLALAEAAARDRAAPGTEALFARLDATAAGLLEPSPRDALRSRFAEDRAALEELLRAAARLGTADATLSAVVAGYGELWSAHLMAAHLRDRGERAAPLDAREVLFLTETGALDPKRSGAALDEWLAARPEIDRVVVTGFVATDAGGRPTTLGRNGSDLSATLLGGLLDADSVTIWTDVAGVLTADPRSVPDPDPVPRLSYAEAMELAYFGAKVLHPKTLAPAEAAAIPVWIKSTFQPDRVGTRIDAEGAPEVPVKALTSIGGMALVELAGPGLVGIPGVARRVFGEIEAEGLSVVLISQASSEHSICFAVPAAQAARARARLDEAFSVDRQRGRVSAARVETGCTILAVVGDGMAGRPGIAARTFDALRRASVNVRAIAQGSSERNLSFVVGEADATRALRAVHAGFWLGGTSLSVGVIGTGVVGTALVDQLRARVSALSEDTGIDIRLRALGRSRKTLLGQPTLELGDDWRAALEAGVNGDVRRLVAHLKADGAPHCAVVDLTASDAVADRYAAWLGSGLHVVTANKRAGSGPLERYRRIRSAARGRGTVWGYETTVGAGLPVLGTLRDLIDTGDRLLHLEALLSGTLGWLFSTWDGGSPFSEVVREAKRRGFTEPDVRDDLSGTDVARKLVILAREAGLPAELDDVEVESLVPSGLESASAAEALEGLGALDAPLARRRELAAAEGHVLRYAAELREGRLTVGLRSYGPDHPFAAARGTDNVVRFTTERYRERPLVVQGPGAGPEVTAAGVFAQLVALARALDR